MSAAVDHEPPIGPDEVAQPDDDETIESDDDEQREPDDGEQREHDDDEQPAPAPVTDDKELERAVKALEKEATRHRNRVSEIMGEDAQSLVPCELCEPAIPGFRWPAVPDTAVTTAVLAAVGFGALGDFKHDPDAETCDLCDGRGALLTGSHVDSQRTRPCPKCTAKGYTTPDERNAWDARASAQRVVATLAPVTSQPLAPAAQMPATDAWTRPLGHAFYGMNPAYMTPEQRADDWEGAR